MVNLKCINTSKYCFYLLFLSKKGHRDMAPNDAAPFSDPFIRTNCKLNYKYGIHCLFYVMLHNHFYIKLVGFSERNVQLS